MLHTGIDLVEMARIDKLLVENRDGFLRRVCTPNEITYLKNQKKVTDKVSAFFALKEAFSKALGTGLGEHLSFQDLEVTYSPKGQPQVHYVGTNYKKAQAWEISCSVSHEKGFLVAIVVLQGELH
jgi:holo-[acyl-carrier protein] synthase